MLRRTALEVLGVMMWLHVHEDFSRCPQSDDGCCMLRWIFSRRCRTGDDCLLRRTALDVLEVVNDEGCCMVRKTALGVLVVMMVTYSGGLL